LAQFKYTVEPRPFSLRERMQYLLISWPLNFARMLIWLLVELIQHNLPGRFGRKPSSNMVVKAKGKNTKAVEA